jgi:hypothetical protein
MRVVFAILLTAAACGDAPSQRPDDLSTPTDSAPSAAAAPADPVGPVADLSPNELGEIMVLEYHRLGENEGEFIRTKENFLKDLDALYQRGYRPITIRQLLDGDVNLPAGTSPVVFTIDDSSLGQFYYLEDGTIDPNTMMGMWERFEARSPGWDNGAVWCVLPAADYPSNFFGDRPSREVPRDEREEMIHRKMTHLVENDHEICNHTLYHARLDHGDDEQVREWIGRGEDSIRIYLPEGYEIVTLSLPLGQWPDNRALAWSGEWDGREYAYQAVLEVAGGPSPSIYDVEFDARSIDRFIVAPGHLERQLDSYESNPGQRFVSDGDPAVISVPAGSEDRVDRARWPGKEVRVIEPGGAG